MPHRNDFEVLAIFGKTVAVSMARVARPSGLWMALHKKGSLLATPNGQLATKHARELPPEFAGAFPDMILGPKRSAEGYWVGQLLQRRAARFDDSTQARIEDLVFEDWLAERRKHASIRWHWV